MIDIKRVNGTYEIADYEKIRTPSGQLEKLVKSKIAHYLADMILNKLDEIPHAYEVRQDVDREREKHVLLLNLISNDEINRLAEIERRYNHMLTGVYGEIKEEPNANKRAG